MKNNLVVLILDVRNDYNENLIGTIVEVSQSFIESSDGYLCFQEVEADYQYSRFDIDKAHQLFPLRFGITDVEILTVL